MRAQELHKHIAGAITDEVKQAFLDVQGEVFIKLNKAMDDMKTANVLPADAKEVFEYGLRAGQFMAITEIFTGFQLDAKEDGEVTIAKTQALEAEKVVTSVVKPCEKNAL